ncbi:PilZ domain-containing protein [Henriciella sp. AS95]|uniref:PilZ domain-containing protein n=1 Tax=Henriciella sp. AS95 TaxID=3135782 RepID=UPI0031764174
MPSLSAMCLAAAFSPLAAASEMQNELDACEAYSPLLATLSTVRAIQASPPEHMSATEYQALGAALESVSLAEMYGDAAQAELAQEYARTSTFIENLSTAIGYYDFGDAKVAGIRANATVPPEVGSGLAELMRREGCSLKNSVEVLERPPRSSLPVGTGHTTAASPQPLIHRRNKTVGAETSSHTDQSNLQRGPVQEGRSIFDYTLANAALIGCLLCLAWIARLVFHSRKKSGTKRRRARQVCHKPVPVRMSGRTAILTIVDISNSGMKLRHDNDLEGESRLEFKVQDKWLRATVTWQNNIYAGAKFARRLRGSEFRFITGQQKRNATSEIPSKASPAAAR